ncbi:hypothetical protein MRBLMS1_000399 [Massilia sp. LMS1-1-1.1]
MRMIRQMFLCGLSGAIIGILLSVGEPFLLVVVVAVMGFVTLLSLYWIIFLVVFFHEKNLEEAHLYSSQLVIDKDEYECGGTKYFGNPAYRLDESGDPDLDPQWLMREPQ